MEDIMSARPVTIAERIVHAVGYELLAVVLSAPVVALALDVSMADAGALSLVMSLVSMLWNMVYNALVDRWYTLERIHWSFTTRLVHGVVFEAGIISMCMLLAVWWLQITLLEAFLLEIGFFVFIFPYTVFYNWGYDKLRYQLVGKQTAIV
ncbi:PACE efflux transporter [Pseudomaricurvus sp. HS19]|nr:PACE efflux transporter [Pseudomaricurvus sp. HS19]